MPTLLGVFVRGMAMGAADIVPGVSGGTIALITGIYDRLLAALAAVDTAWVKLLLTGRIRDAWEKVDATFLLVLLSGAVTSVLLLANVIDWAMATAPELLWSFFFGLVAASAVLLWRSELPQTRLADGALLLLGAVLAVAVALSPGGQFIPGLVGFLLAGAIAICAMILPGISGSFILLLLGMYPAVISALTTPRITELLVFATGCAVGLLSFSKLLHWLLDHQRRRIMALLTGFLLGSTTALWPWRRVVSTVIDRHGEPRPVQQLPVLPETYAAAGGDPQVLLCAMAVTAGLLLVVVTHWVAAGRARP